MKKCRYLASECDSWGHQIRSITRAAFHSCVLSWNGAVSKAPLQLPLMFSWARRRHCDGPADKTGRRGAAGDRKSFRMPRKAAEIRRLPEAQRWVKWERAPPVSQSEGQQKGLEGYSPALTVSAASKMCFSMSTHPKNNSRRHSTPKNTWSGTAAAHCFPMHQNLLLQVNN